MSSDPSNSFQGTTTSTPLPSFGGSSDSSLAQSARLKTLKTARAVLFILGILMMLGYGFLYSQAAAEMNLVIDQELAKQGLNRGNADVVELQKWEEASLRILRMIYGGGVAVGAVFFIAGFFMLKFPVPTAIGSLVLFVGKTVIEAYLAPESLVQGFLLKIIVVVALGSAVKAAIAYQKTRQDDTPSAFQGAAG